MMKKFIVLFYTVILIACTPQVTVTSEVTVTLPPPTDTPIPTPTLHPEFIELQNLINDSSEKFILLPDGTIEELTADGTKQIIPNLKIDQNGIINIVFNNEHIVIEQSQIAFDDENGVVIEGYTLDKNGEWVVAISEAVTAVTTQMDAWHVDPATYTCAEIGENVICTDLEGKEIFNNGDYDVFWLRETLVNSGDLMPTKYAPRTDLNRVLPGTPTDQMRVEYLFGVLSDQFVNDCVEKFGIDPTRDENGKLRNGIAYLLDPSINA